MTTKLLNAATADIAAPTSVADSNYAEIVGNQGALGVAVHVFGTWDGAQIDLYTGFNGISNAVLIKSFTVPSTPDDGDNFQMLPIPGGTGVYAVLTGADALTNLNLWIGGQGSD